MKIFTAKEAREQTKKSKERLFMLNLVMLAIKDAAFKGETSLSYTIEFRKDNEDTDRKNAVLVKQILIKNGYYVKSTIDINKKENRVERTHLVIDWSKE